MSGRRKTISGIAWSPSDYDQASFLARFVGNEMVARLQWVTLKPAVILDVGCGVGAMSASLQARYQEAFVISVDIDHSMLHYAKQQAPQLACLCADGGRLPFRDKTIDLIAANFLLPWHADIKSLFYEWKRLLRPDGLLMVSALGPDTLQEWKATFLHDTMPNFVDMHDIGDMLLQVGFADPVLDVNRYTVAYREKTRLFAELAASGMWFSEDEATDRQALSSSSHVQSSNETWDVTYEVIQAHAFAKTEHERTAVKEDGVSRIPLSHLRQQLQSK